MALAAALNLGSDGEVRLRRDLDLPPYDRALSGWYWQVSGDGVLLRSRSLGTATLSLDEPAKGPRDEPLQLRRRAVRLTGGSEPLELVAAAPREAAKCADRTARRTLNDHTRALALALLGAVTAQVFLALQPLRRLSRALAEVRSGRARSVPNASPPKSPILVVELNALLAQNADQVERAAAHIGNLAHGLKTPLATLAAELRPGHDAERDTLRTLVESMDRRIAHHLRRARSAALLGGRHFEHGSPRRSTICAGAVQDPCRARLALQRLGAGRSRTGLRQPTTSTKCAATCSINACKWAAGEVAISAERQAAAHRHQRAGRWQGFGSDMAEIALKRGGRLDEVTPGSGFASPITREIAALYGGDLTITAPAAWAPRHLTLPAAD